MARFSRETRQQLQDNAAFTTERLGSVPGIEVIVPQGAMYVMVRRRAGRRPSTPSLTARGLCSVKSTSRPSTASQTTWISRRSCWTRSPSSSSPAACVAANGRGSNALIRR